MAKFKVIKKYIKGKTGEEIDVGTIIDVAKGRIEALKILGIINKPVRSERIKKKKE